MNKILFLTAILLSSIACANTTKINQSKDELTSPPLRFSCPDGEILSGRIWNRAPDNQGCIFGGTNPNIRCTFENYYTDVEYKCIKK